jgi:CMP/dCMP kinase
LQIGLDLDDHLKLEQLAQQAKIEFLPGTSTVRLNDEDVTSTILEPHVAEAASKVSAIAGVRRAMVLEQRRIAEGVSVVMEGRDIGTVVFPDAAVKVYLDADVQIRAERRTREMEQRGQAADLDEIASQIVERDRRDATRVEAPMVQAPDAVYLNSSGMTPEEVDDAILRIVRSRVSNGKEVLR